MPLGALVQINLRQNFLSVENVETSAVKIDRAKTRPRWPPGSAEEREILGRDTKN